MEQTLKALFDYQRFEEHPVLQQVIDSVHSRYSGRALSLDELEMVTAAGTPEIGSGQKKPGCDPHADGRV